MSAHDKPANETIPFLILGFAPPKTVWRKYWRKTQISKEFVHVFPKLIA